MTSEVLENDSKTCGSDEPVVLICGVEPYHEHEFPADWTFAGPTGLDFRADVRWKPTTYTYFDNKIRTLHSTQVPTCDDMALDYFTQVAGFGPDYLPKWVQALRPGEDKPVTLPFTYNNSTDEVWEND